MKHIRNPKSIHAMNRYVSEMAHPKLATCHDVDAVYHNHIKDFWCMFEWKWESEKMCKPGTLQSLHDMDVALNAGSPNYRGLFIVRLNFPEEFPLDDTQACKIQHIWGGFVEGHQVYTRKRTHGDSAYFGPWQATIMRSRDRKLSIGSRSIARTSKVRLAVSRSSWRTGRRTTSLRPLFGTLREDGLRQYRQAYIEVPRKNGKSNLCAAIALYMLFADGEPGAEIISAAGDRNQARIVFEIASAMCATNPKLSGHGKVLRNTIEYKNSFYKAISAEANTKHGFNAHAVILDELHVFPDRDLYDVLKDLNWRTHAADGDCYHYRRP